MPLGTGTRLGAYEVSALIGAGGMGEVYRARDTRLNRDVALKVLPELFATDPDRLARFKREAQLLASLNHPNIAAIYGFEEGPAEAGPYVPGVGAGFSRLGGALVLELVEGPALADRIAQGPIPLDEALPIARQIAEALEAAHEHGVIHRDLKPANIKVRPDGTVKVLDFGLAKAFESDVVGTGFSRPDTMSPTITSPAATRLGVILGTAAYMSPEQARGKPVDKRSDIWAFGCVLYEMLSGRPTFGGDSVADVLARVIEHDPNWKALPSRTSPAILRLLRRSLEKDPKRRLPDIRVARMEIDEATSAPAMARAEAAIDPPGLTAQPAILIAVSVIAVLLGILAGRSFPTEPQFSDLKFEPRTFEPQTIFNARFGPDGETVVFSAALEGNSPEVFVSRPGATEPEPLSLPRTHLLSVSSTGELAVLTDAVFVNHRLFRGTLARMPIDGTPRPILESVREADWSPDGSMLAIIRDMTPSITGHRTIGATDRLEYPIGAVLHQAAGYLSDLRISPDGTRVAFFEHPLRFDDGGWVKVVDREGVVRTLAGEYWGLQGLAWTIDGETLLYSAGQSSSIYELHAVQASGNRAARPILPTPGGSWILDTNRADEWLVTRNDSYWGLRARLSGEAAEREVGWLDFAWSPELSSDGRLMLFTDGSTLTDGGYTVALRRADGTPPVRLGEGSSIALSPDGTKALAYIFAPSPMVVVYPVGPGEPVRLKPGPIEHITGAVGPMPAMGWFPDNRRIVVCGNETGKAFRCYQQDLSGEVPTPLTPEGHMAGPISPDGRLMVLVAPDGTKLMFSLTDGTTRPIAGLAIEDVVRAWTNDARGLLVVRSGQTSARIDRLDLATGGRDRLHDLTLADRKGLLRIGWISVADNGRGYAYDYMRRLSRLFVARGIGDVAPN